MGRDILEKLTVDQLVEKFPAFYRARKFITVLTRGREALALYNIL
jgi:hypothetical protein